MSYKIPKEFVLRRLHSLAGLWLVFFIIEHLLTNSQSALLIGHDGSGFIRAVNFIHSLPYLPLIELGLLAVPFLIHGLWGIKYAMESKNNSMNKGDQAPHLPYKRNKAFTWQRITSWILLVGVILHVANMRFIHYPDEAQIGTTPYYFVKVSYDEGLETLGARLGFTVYNQEAIARTEIELESLQSGKTPVDKMFQEQKTSFVHALTSSQLKPGEVIISAPDFGTASLLVVRNTFKQPLMIILYSLFVIATVYHAFNGLWTAFITWGINLKEETQKKFLRVTQGLMFVVGLLGLASVWLTYYNLSY